MTYNKWQSRRWLVCVWAVLLATILILWLMSQQGKEVPSWVGLTLNLFQGIIMLYIAADSFTKPKGVA